MMNMATNVKQDIVSELHRPARKHFQRRRVILKGLNDLFQADLIEVIPYARFNKGYKYILVVIDAFSKFVWAVPIKNKSAKSVTMAFKGILSKLPEKPKNLQTDEGTEFYNALFRNLMKLYDINHYSTYSTKKASIVERSIRTLKSTIWKHFSLQGKYVWVNELQNIINKYNTTKHRTIQMKPADVNKSNELLVLKRAYTHPKVIDPRKAKFKVGDYVRISKFRHAFDKSYTPNWTTEIFQIVKVKQTFPRTYILQDSKNEEIKGSFYKHELSKVKHSDIYLVERIIKRRGDKVFVKWLGMDNKHNSWISREGIQ